MLWINYLAPAPSPLKAYPNASYVVATAGTPRGPFRIVTPRAAVAVAGGGDFTLFVDGHVGYIAYDAWKDDHRVSIEQLDEVCVYVCMCSVCVYV